MPEEKRREWIKSNMDHIEDRLYRYRAKRLRFLINGDKHFAGINYALNTEKIRSFDALLNDLTRSLSMDHLKLCKGVRFIFSLEGALVQALTDFLDGQTYICSSTDAYIVTDYRLSNGKLNWLVRNSACISSSEKVRIKRNVPQSPAPSARYQNRQSSPHPKQSNRFNTSHDNHSYNQNGAGSASGAPNGINHSSQTKEMCLNKMNNSNHQHNNPVTNTPTQTRRHVRNNIDETSHNSGAAHSRANNICKSPNLSIRSANKTPKTNHAAPKTILQPKQTPKKIDQLAQQPQQQLPPAPIGLFGQEVITKYDIGRPIGDGHFSVVYCCMNKDTQEFCALKLIDKLKCRGRDDMIYNEVKILKRLNHPNIVKLIEEFDYSKQLYLILELVQDGDLFDAISNVTKFGEVDVATMIHNLSSALTYLHKQGIVHRDIKPENLLISVQDDGSQSVKLADFGLAVEVDDDAPLYNVCGTAFYVSPEMLNEAGYSYKVDVWSTGVICFILLCGYPPFTSENENNQDELFDAILAGDFQFAPSYWSKISQDAKNLIKCMLTVDPEKRYTAEQVFTHPWTMGTSSNFEGINPMNKSRKIALQSH
uniref:non-specific serine/threonine protein kinase n=1 Tax=Aceria tosichella TaxID=561515 RepID=A0A6G1SGN8_9ACAR